MKFATDRQLDLILVGRAGIDFNTSQLNRRFAEVESFTKSVGGSPANIAQGVARLGLRTGFIGKVSADGMGDYIVETFQKAGILTDGIVRDTSSAPNCLAITEVLAPTQSSSFFYRERTADLQLAPEEVSEALIQSAAAVLISGTALSQSPSREAVFTIIDLARRHGTKVLLDIDFRPFGWQSPIETALYYSMVAEKCDLILGNREEFNAVEYVFMPDNRDNAKSAAAWLAKGVEIVIIKAGADGSCAYTKDGDEISLGVIPVPFKKTFGSGDAYASGLLYGLFKGLALDEAMKLGTACAAIVLAGPISCADGLPTLQQATEFLAANPLTAIVRKAGA